MSYPDYQFEVELGALKSPRRKPRRSWFDKEKMMSQSSMGSGVNPFTIPSDDAQITEYDVMIVDHFSRPPKIDFGDTMQGKCKRRYLKIINEREEDVILSIDKIPDNFSLSIGTENTISVSSNSHVMIWIMWEPVEVGGQHGVIKFVADNTLKTFRLHLSVFGKCQPDPKAKKLKKRRPLQSTTQNKTVSMRSQSVSVPSKAGTVKPLTTTMSTVRKPGNKENMHPPGTVLIDRKKSSSVVSKTVVSKSVKSRPVLGVKSAQEEVREASKSDQYKLPPVILDDSVFEDTLIHDVTTAELHTQSQLKTPARTFLVHNASLLETPLSGSVTLSQITPASDFPLQKSLSLTDLQDTPLAKHTPSSADSTMQNTPDTMILQNTLSGSADNTLQNTPVLSVAQTSDLCTPPNVIGQKYQELCDDIGPLTPVNELANNKYTALSEAMKRRSTFVLEEPTQSNTPTITVSGSLCTQVQPDHPALPEHRALPDHPALPDHRAGSQKKTSIDQVLSSLDDSFTPDSLDSQTTGNAKQTKASVEKKLSGEESPLAESSFCLQTVTVEETIRPAVTHQPSMPPCSTVRRQLASTRYVGNSTHLSDLPGNVSHLSDVTLGGVSVIHHIDDTADLSAIRGSTSSSGSSTERPPKRKSLDRQTTPEKFIKVTRRTSHRLPLAKAPSTVKTLRLMRPNLSSTVRKTLPYVTKNRFYDDRWKEKQERGFTRWINHILTPVPPCETGEGDDSNNASDNTTSSTLSGGGESLLMTTSQGKKAPSKEVMSLRTYTAIRKLNTLRQKALQLFQTDSMLDIFTSVEEAVDNKKFSVRQDKSIHADIGLRNQLVTVLMSYTPLWLRIGLEALLGEAIELRSPRDTHTLKLVLNQRVLGDPYLTAQYAHPHVANLYKTGYQTEIGKHILKKILILVYFLDKAKQERLIDFDPCLFCVKSEYKSSRDILLFTARELMAGEGDITRHLAYLGYKVSYQQKALDEYDYGVTSIKQDLRDGARLTKIMETVTKDYSLIKRLRIPAESLTNKRANVQIALKSLISSGVDNCDIKSEDIVSGHREKTLKLLWIIISHFQLSQLVNLEVLRDEVQRLERTLRSSRGSVSVDQSLKQDSTAVGMLLYWSALVCAHHDVTVSNFSASYTDGRALCYLVKHYQPSLIGHIHDVTTLTKLSSSPDHQNMAESFIDTTVLDDSSASLTDLLHNDKENFRHVHKAVTELGGIPIISTSADMVSTVPDEKITTLYVTYICARLLELREETWAARVLQIKWRQKMQARRDALIQATRTNACLTIQRWYRTYKPCRDQRLAYLRSRSLILLVQRTWRARKACEAARQNYLNLRKSALIIQGFWVRRRVEKMRQEQREMRLRAAVTIQRWYRECRDVRVQREKYLRIRWASLLIQRWWWNVCLTRRQRSAYTERLAMLKMAVACIEERRKAVLVSRKERDRYKNIRQAAVRIQLWYRGVVVARETRTCFGLKREACVAIQRWYRSHLLRKCAAKDFHARKTACVILQRWYRRCNLLKADRAQFLCKKETCVTIQQWYRSCVLRKVQQQMFCHQQKAAIMIQRFVRAHVIKNTDQLLYLKQKSAVLKLQEQWRAQRIMRLQRDEYLMNRKACTLIQDWYRACVLRKQQQKDYLQKRKAAITIQKYVRAHVMSHPLRQQYLCTKSATILIQRRWRGQRLTRSALDEFQCMRRACITVQRWFRARKFAADQRETFVSMRQAALVIQHGWRGHQLTKKLNKEYVEKRKAAMFVQTWFRSVTLSKKIRNHYLEQKSAAVVIQRQFRATILASEQQEQYQLKRHYCIQIQQWYRAQMAGKRLRSKYLLIRQAAILIQQRWRSRKLTTILSQKFQSQRASAITIQRWYHSSLLANACRNAHIRLISATITIQRHWRARRQMRADQASFQSMKSAAIFIQTYWRMWRVMIQLRAHYLLQKKAVVTIQRQWKANCVGRLARTEFRIMKTSTMVIQRRWRAFRLAVLAKSNYASKRQAAICIQRYWRSMQAAKKSQSDYLQLKAATLVLQDRWRANVLMQTVRLMYLKERTAAVCIQNRWRAYRVGKIQLAQYSEMKSAVLIMQRFWLARQLMMLEKTGYEDKRAAAVCIQQQWRAHQLGKAQMAEFVGMKSAAVSTQRSWRARRQMRAEMLTYKKQRAAVITIQAQWRAHKEAAAVRGWYMRQKTAVLALQRTWRDYRVMSEQRENFLRMKAAATTIQRFWRGHQKLMVCRAEYMKLKEVAVVIQQRWRAKNLMLKDQVAFQITRNAVLFMQRRWRSVKGARLIRSDFVAMQEAASRIQLWYRALKLRQKEQAVYQLKHVSALHIQSWFRSLLLARRQRQEFQSQKKAAVTIQRIFRALCTMRHCVRQFKLTRDSVVRIQRFWRSRKVTKEAMEKYRLMKNAATLLQQRYRAYRLMKADIVIYHQKKAAVLCIQRRYQAYKCMMKERAAFTLARQSAVVIQQCWRAKNVMVLCRDNFANQKRAASVIQSFYRSVKVGRACKQLFIAYKRSAICIQRWWRLQLEGNRWRSKFMRERQAALKIQRWWRFCVKMLTLRSEYQTNRCAAITIQRYWRASHTARNARAEYRNMREAALILQRRWRTRQLALSAKHDYSATQRSVITIQRCWRSYRVRRSARQRSEAALTIQRWWRNRQATKSYYTVYQKLRTSAITIQRRWRSHRTAEVTRGKLVRLRRAVLILQKRWRDVLSLRADRKRREELRLAKKHMNSIIKIQSWTRMMLIRRQYLRCLDDMKLQTTAAIVLQAHIRRWLAKRHAAIRLGAIITIQAIWRGRSVRSKHTNRTRKMSEIRMRLISANKRASSQLTLAQRTTTALNFVLKYKMISKIMEALRHLIVTTRWSHVCRLGIARSQALVELITLMRSCNRSEPHKEILQLSLEVLNNIAEDSVTAPLIIDTHHLIYITTELMTIYVETGPYVFRAGCTLLATFTRYPPLKQRLLDDGTFMTQIENITRVADRKFVIAQKTKSKKLRLAYQSQQAAQNLKNSLTSELQDD